MALAICTAADVITRAGGLAVVVKVIPLATNQTTYDPAVMAAAIADAGEEFASYANVQLQIQAWAQAIAQNPALSWPAMAVDCVAWKACGKLWVMGAVGQAKPQYVKDEESRVQGVEHELRSNRISLGAPQQPLTLQPQVGLVDLDPCKNRMTLQGFQEWFC